MVLGVHRIDGDKRQIAPVLAAFQRRGLGGFRFRERGGAEDVGNFVGVDRDQADRALALHRAQALAHLHLRLPVGALLEEIGHHEVTFHGAAFAAFGHHQLAAEAFLVHRHEAAAAAGRRPEDAKDLRARLLDELDDAAVVADRVLGIAGFLGAQEPPVADAGGGAGLGRAGEDQADARRRAVLLLVPLHGLGDELAVVVSRGHFRYHHGGQAAGDGELAAAARQLARVVQPAQDLPELGLARPVEAEGAHEVALGHVAAARGDEGYEFFAARRAAAGLLLMRTLGQGRRLYHTAARRRLASPARTSGSASSLLGAMIWAPATPGMFASSVTSSVQMRRPSARGSAARSMRSMTPSGMMVPGSLSFIQRAERAERSGAMPTMRKICSVRPSSARRRT